MGKRILMGILAMIVFLFACSSGNKQITNDKQVIKIGYLPITHATPLFLDVHLHHGQFELYDIELVKFSSWPDLIDALNAGQIDGASVLMQLAMQAKEKGIGLKAVALGHKDGNVIVTAHDIEKASDLKGTTFAIPHTHSAHHLLLNEMLTLKGVAYSDVDVIELPPPEMPAALAGERISGYVVAEPFGAMAVNMGIGKVFAFSEDIWPNSYCCVLVFRNDFIANNEKVTYEFINSYVAAGKLTYEKSNDLYDALQTYLNVENDVLDLSLEWISFDSLRIEEEEYDKLIDRILQLELMEHPPTYDEFIDSSFIDEAK